MPPAASWLLAPLPSSRVGLSLVSRVAFPLPLEVLAGTLLLRDPPAASVAEPFPDGTRASRVSAALLAAAPAAVSLRRVPRALFLSRREIPCSLPRSQLYGYRLQGLHLGPALGTHPPVPDGPGREDLAEPSALLLRRSCLHRGSRLLLAVSRGLLSVASVLGVRFLGVALALVG